MVATFNTLEAPLDSSRTFSTRLVAGLFALLYCIASLAAAQKPNFIIIYADDLGYGDLACYGNKRIKTPNLDEMAAQGVRFTDFYSAGAVCTPSRAALLTGCYPKRVSLGSSPNYNKDKLSTHSVILSTSPVGLHPDEITIAELLKPLGYATACIGKWHLGHYPQFLPTRQGFDYYYGIPYSNDMKPTVVLRNEKIVEREANQPMLTETYTSEAIRFITENRETPFFLYLPHNMPHTPIHASDRFRGRSAQGLYGDVVQCIDWSVGEILTTLKSLGIDDRTFVMFSSDNGPWYMRGEHGGIATPLRNGKGSTYEGGMRVPCIMRWPGKIPAGTTCGQLAATIDMLPTIAAFAGAAVPSDRIIDGTDIRPLLTGVAGAQTPHEAFFYYHLDDLQAVRSGQWKLRLKTRGPGGEETPEELFDLDYDIGEQKSVLMDHRDIAKRLRQLAQKARLDLGDAATGVIGAGVRPAGYTTDPITSSAVHPSVD